MTPSSYQTNKVSPQAADKKTQIFIGGCGRSGTTLLGAMLGAGQGCITTPESQFKIGVLKSIKDPHKLTQPQEIAKEIAQHFRFRIWEMEVDNVSLFAKEIKTYADLIHGIVDQYAQKHKTPDWRTWVDHTPHNIRYIATLLSLFPNAKFIHIIRDGRAVASSIIPLDWGPNNIIEAASWWMTQISYGLVAEQAFPERVLRIRYEDLITQTESTLKTICDFAEITYSQEMAHGRGFATPAYTKRQHSLVGKALDKSRTDRWKTLLTEREIEIFENLTCELLSYLDYQLQYGLKARQTRTIEAYQIRICSTLKYKYQRFANNLHKRLHKRHWFIRRATG